MTYDEPENLGGLHGMWLYANNVTDQWFSPLFIITTWIIIFFYMKNKGLPNNNVAFVAGFFIVTLTAFLRVASLISDYALFFTVLALAIPTLLLWLSE